MTKKIAIVTTKQPGTNPRMRKNADALSNAGYDVLVLYAYNTLWADKTDEELFKRIQWKYMRIGGHPKRARARYLVHRVIRKVAAFFRWTDLEFCPSRSSYLRALQKFDPHLVLGHNPGALPVLSRWSYDTGGLTLFDAEDFHSGEYTDGSPEQNKFNQFESKYLSQLKWMTAASPLIGNAYRERFPNVSITTIDNAFESTLQPSFSASLDSPLKLVWFSQVIGLDRGLKETLNHLKLIPNTPLEITLIGSCNAETRIHLEHTITSSNHKLFWHPPCSELELMKLCSTHHIGLAVEPGFSTNNHFARSNKLYTYPICGCWTMASKTPAQIDFFQENPDLGETLDLLDGQSWALRLEQLANSLEELAQLRRAAWTKARDCLNWETESQKLISLVDEIMKR